ncbi:MAG: hypothetical protein ACOVRB_12155 [Akkermansiaceae bacterium]
MNVMRWGDAVTVFLLGDERQCLGGTLWRLFSRLKRITGLDQEKILLPR